MERKWFLPASFATAQNAGVRAYLDAQQPSAHSDVSSELLLAAEHLRENRLWFCPDTQAYAYVALHTKAGVFYGLALGMNQLLFRLPSTWHGRATADGGTRFTPAGPEWFSWTAFAADAPLAASRERWRKWCDNAWRYAEYGEV